MTDIGLLRRLSASASASASASWRMADGGWRLAEQASRNDN